MVISHSERRQVENEMIFRRRNEKVGDDLSALDAMLIDDGNRVLVHDEDLVLQFMCECSDENCTTRIPMPLSEYQEIHTDRDTFVVLPNHQVEAIEKVHKVTKNYSVVKKNVTIAEPSGGLNDTPIDNA